MLRERLRGLLLIREGESGRVLYFTVFFILLGTGLALGRGTKDALFLKRYGIEYLPLMYILLGFSLVLASTIYAAFVDRVSSESLFKWLFAALSLTLLGSWVVMTSSASEFVYPAYYLIYEVASELLLIHASLYVSQNLDTLQIKRLSTLIFSGLQIGTFIGGLLLTFLAPWLGTQNMLLVWVAIVLVTTVQAVGWHRVHGVSAYFRAPRRKKKRVAEAVQQVGQGIRFTSNSALLRYLSLAFFCMVVVYYMLGYSTNWVYLETFGNERELAAFYGALFAASSALCLAFQLLITNRFMGRFGVRRTNLVFPATSLLSYAGLIAWFGLPTAIFGSINRDVILAAFHNPAQAMFYNALPHYMQGRARAMVMMLVMPAALVVCGVLLWLTQQLSSPLYFLMPGAVAAGLFLYYSHRMNGAYVDTLVSTLKERLDLPLEEPAAGLRGSGDAVYETLRRGLDDPDEQMALTFAKLLLEAFPDRAGQAITERISRATPALVDRMVRLVGPQSREAVDAALSRASASGDDHLKATCLRVLIGQGVPDVKGEIPGLLADASPRLRATGVLGVFRYPVEGLQDEALRVWLALLEGGVGEQLASLQCRAAMKGLAPDVVEQLERGYHLAIVRLFRGRDSAVTSRVLAALGEWDGPGLPDIDNYLAELFRSTDPRQRAMAIRGARVLPESACMPLVEQALDDGHQHVRNAAVDVLRLKRPDLAGFAITWIVEDNRGSPRSQQTLLDTLLEQGVTNRDIERIAIAKANSALGCYRALAALKRDRRRDDPAFRLLMCVLAERVVQWANVALAALQPITGSSAIAVIRAGIRSRDTRYVAQAYEVLQNLDNQSIARMLGALLGEVKPAGMRDLSGAHLNTVGDVLSWCARQKDTWLRSCACEVE